MKEISTAYFIKVVLLTSIWIHASEVFRYFVLVIPRTKAYFSERTDVAEMNVWIFSLWGLWDMLLTTLMVLSIWACMQLYGNSQKSILRAALFSWSFFFVLFWVGTANMGLASWDILLITLPLSAFEMWVGCLIASKLFNRKTQKQVSV